MPINAAATLVAVWSPYVSLALFGALELFYVLGSSLFELLFVIDVQIGTVGYLLTLRPLDAHIRIGPPVPLDDFADRKALARYAEEKVRNDVAELLREGGLAKPS